MYETRLAQFVTDLYAVLGEKLESVILYGSEARGTASEDSDIDIVILLRDPLTGVENERMSDLLVDFNIDTGRVLSVIDVSKDDSLKWGGTMPFFQNLSREGRALWTTTA